MYRISPDGRRMIIMPPVGCYEGKPTPDGWQGELIGTTVDMAVVNAWLGGEDVPADAFGEDRDELPG